MISNETEVKGLTAEDTGRYLFWISVYSAAFVLVVCTLCAITVGCN
jgi:hypothetical protein